MKPGRTMRVAFLAAVAAAMILPAAAQDETTGSAGRPEGRRRGPGMLRDRGGDRGPATTASLEQRFDETQRPLYEAAGIPAEKILQIRQLEVEARMAQSRGEQVDYRGMREKRMQILSREELQKLMDVSRQRRDGRNGATTGTATSTTASLPIQSNI